MTIDVTQELIDAAVAARAGPGAHPSLCQQDCAIAAAAAVAFEREEGDDLDSLDGLWVDADWLLVRTEDWYEYRWQLPPEAIRHYEAFDRGEPVRPARFDLGEPSVRYIDEEEWEREQGLSDGGDGGDGEAVALPPRVAAACERAWGGAA